MNIDEMRELWVGAGKGVSPERMRAAAEAAAGREQRRRRGMLAYVFVMVPLTTAGVGAMALRKGIGMEEAWPAWGMLLAQWAVAFYLLRLFRRRAADRPIRAALETLHAQARERCRELQVLLGLFAVVTPLAVAALLQLQESGKMRPNEAASAAVLFAVVLAGMGGWITFDLVARKLPERRHLETLLRDYRAEI
jgi:positive regulator of sigma E activity